jgi:CheY-like chemotaxis protein/HPt (histidine-containing phosphotransfer) domain-containing protein
MKASTAVVPRFCQGRCMVDQALETRRTADDHGPIVVLLVDDQPFIGAAVGRLLATEHDIDLHYCRDPLEAIALANRINPSIIIQDLIMPNIDGLTLVRSFQSNPPTANTPVIVLSGNDDAHTRARALAHGAADYLVKLPGKDDLIACIRRHVAAGAILSETGSAALDPPTALPRLDTGETLDRGMIAAFQQADAAGGADFTLTLIDQFLREAASQIETLRDAARRSDAPALKATAHSLKGSSMTMGAKRLADLCSRAEDAAGCQSDGGAATLLAEIDRELVCVRNALTAERQNLDRR